MDFKFVAVLVVAVNCYTCCGAALRRTPKVYNALITTDENLTMSRAYPVIQPTIHESGRAHYPFGPFGPYSFYTPPVVRFGQPIVPGLAPRGGQLPYALAPNRFPPQVIAGPPNVEPQVVPPYLQNGPPPPLEKRLEMPAPAPAPATAPGPMYSPEEQQPLSPPVSPSGPASPPQPAPYLPFENARPQQMPNEKLPIPLNEYGLPPALIPLNPYGNRNVGRLPAYGFNQYPLIYDPITGFREQYLPPYDYLPSHSASFGVAPPSKVQPQLQPQPQLPQSQPQPQPAPKPNPTLTPTSTIDEAGNPAGGTDQIPTTPDFESIKNGSKSNDSDIPDVPPPPIPTGAKTSQS